MISEANQIKEFLTESNAIEGVYGIDALLQAQKAWDYIIKKPKLNLGRILEAHKILMRGQKLKMKYRGVLRTEDVAIGKWEIIGVDGDKLLKKFTKTGEVKPWQEVPELMQKWIHDVNTLIEFKDKWVKDHGQHEERIKTLHIEFEHIHGFMDGNGRLGRLLMNWQRIKVGLPILIIYESEKSNYYQWFK